MINLPSDVLALMDEGRIKIAGLMLAQLPSGNYGFIRSEQPLTWNGVTYIPGGIIEVSELISSSGTNAQQFTITLAASPDDGLTPDILKTIEAEDYRDRPVTIYDAYFHPDTGALLHVQPMRRGYIDTIDHITSQSSGYTLEASCETRALDYTRTNGRKRNVTDQKRRAPGDRFLEHVSMRGRQEYFWGREKGK